MKNTNIKKQYNCRPI